MRTQHKLNGSWTPGSFLLPPLEVPILFRGKCCLWRKRRKRHMRWVWGHTVRRQKVDKHNESIRWTIKRCLSGNHAGCISLCYPNTLTARQKADAAGFLEAPSPAILDWNEISFQIKCKVGLDTWGRPLTFTHIMTCKYIHSHIKSIHICTCA